MFLTDISPNIAPITFSLLLDQGRFLVVVHVVASPGMLIKISHCFIDLTVLPVARQTKVA